MNTKLRQKAKYNFEKIFFMLMNNAVFRKTMENTEILNGRYIKLVTTKDNKLFCIRNKLSNCKVFQRKCMATEMRKNLKIYE